MTARAVLALIPGGDADQADRREALAEAHPEIDWLGRIGGVHSAWVRLPRGGYQMGGDSLRELLDKIDDFFREPEQDPDG